MKIAFAIHTPGQAHLWRCPILLLKSKGHMVKVLARDDGSTCELLTSHGIEFSTYGKSAKTSTRKIMQLPAQFVKCFGIMREFRPDVIVGAGIIEAYASVLLRKPCIIFEDSEPTPSLERAQWKPLADAIITPDCFKLDLGKKHVRIAGYKELAYLHPNYFKPDSSILNELGLSKNEKYVILRFNVFDAVHDIGRHGFTATDQLKLVEELKKHAKVFISPEGILAKELESHLLPIAYDRIHHALYYANMIVSDTGTMTTEAAILGTPGIMCLSNARQFGNFIELEQKYNLIYSFCEPDQASQKAVELIQQPDLKEQWAIKRRKLLADKIDVTQFMVDFIENYPESFSKYKR